MDEIFGAILEGVAWIGHALVEIAFECLVDLPLDGLASKRAEAKTGEAPPPV